MYQTSNEYKLKVYEPSTIHLLKVYINDVEIDKKYILDIKISQPIFNNDQFCLGSVTSKAVELKLYKTAVPEQIHRVYIESGIIGESIPIGYFNLEEISMSDDYTVTLKLLDDMIKFECKYDGSSLTYPCTLKSILEDICREVNIELRFYYFYKYECRSICI